MGRYIGSVCRLCRREGEKLFLKGFRCDTAKCSFSKRDYPPGMRHFRRGKRSPYGLRLREKQKVKRFYGVLEKQFLRYFKEAERMKGNTGDNLLSRLERRLDNVVYRLGLALSRRQARQMIRHEHIKVNGRRMTIPSYIVSTGEAIGISSVEKTTNWVKENMEMTKSLELPSWLSLDTATIEGKVLNIPTREEVSLPVSEQLIVEFLSR